MDFKTMGEEEFSEARHNPVRPEALRQAVGEEERERVKQRRKEVKREETEERQREKKKRVKRVGNQKEYQDRKG